MYMRYLNLFVKRKKIGKLVIRMFTNYVYTIVYYIDNDQKLERYLFLIKIYQ